MSASPLLVDQPITERPKVLRAGPVAPYDNFSVWKPWVVVWRTARRCDLCTARFRTHGRALERANLAALHNDRVRANGGGVGQSDYALAGPKDAQP